MDRPNRLGKPVTRAMRKAPMALAAGGLIVLAAGMLVGRTAWQPQPADTVEIADLPAAEHAPAPASVEQPAAPVNARPVAPDVVAIPEIEPETLVRVAPREPLSPFSRPLPLPRPDNSRINQPVAEAAGRIAGNGLVVSIAGVDVVEPDEYCIDPDGIDWPCGMRARTAFRGLLRGRAIACDIPDEFEGDEITAACSVGKQDLGRWIVANGWGRAAPSGPYVAEGNAAREAEKGIFGDGPLPLPIFTEIPDFMNDR